MQPDKSISTLILDVISVDAFLALDSRILTEERLHPDAAAHLFADAAKNAKAKEYQINIGVPEADLDRKPEVKAAINNFFTCEIERSHQELQEIFHDGRITTSVGLFFVAILLGIAQAITGISDGHLATAISESITVFAWVAMWRPAELLLYDHWPARRRIKQATKLARAKVSLYKS
jgi:hypothetical protein